MNRNKIFKELMDSVYKLTYSVHEYEMIPRTYGTDDLFYMVEMHTLEIIADNEGLTATEIVQMTNRTRGAVSQMLEKLTVKGLIERNKNPDNLREQFIRLTEKGHIVNTYHKTLDKCQYNKYLKIMSEFKDEDFITFIKISNTLTEGTKRSIDGKPIDYIE